MTKKARKRSFSSLNEREKDVFSAKTARLHLDEGVTKKQVADKLGLSDARVVNKLLAYAREHGIVKITINKGRSSLYTQSQRNSNLENALVNHFDELEQAVVVNIPSYQESEEAIEKDTRLSQILGRALAEELRIILRSGDNIGVTGGRATFACAQSMRILSQKYAFPQENIVVTSLAGSISRVPEILPFELMSADNVAFTMGSALKDATLRLLSVPSFTLSGKADYLKYPTEKFVSEKEWEKNKSLVPDVAIVGIGVVKEKTHPFFYHNKLELEPIRDLLLSLKEQIEAVEYDAVGDLVTNLFIINPPEGIEEVEQTKIKKLETLIGQINPNSMTPTLKQLREIKLVIAVAGGEYKRDAIWTVLTKPELSVVRGLCTDSETAEWLIAKKEGLGFNSISPKLS